MKVWVAVNKKGHILNAGWRRADIEQWAKWGDHEVRAATLKLEARKRKP